MARFSDAAVENIVTYLMSKYPTVYVDEILDEINGVVSSGIVLESNDENSGFNNVDDKDEMLYKQAIKIVLNEKKTSISYIQRQLRIGYNKSANLIERMEREGILSSPNHKRKKRNFKK